jgi:uncharacterized lipoprotein YajG
MKNLFILIIIVLLFSCQKIEHCKTCTTVTTGSGVNTTVQFSACGDDLKAIDGQVITSTATSGNITVTIISRTTCR